MGYCEGREKELLLKSAWVLVNASIHEGLAVSFLEALAAKTPVLSVVDPEQVVSRFGVLAPWTPGTGMASLDDLEAGLRKLLTDEEFRQRQAEAGYQWVTATHNRAQFLKAFAVLCQELQVAP